jgi:hypothetical protein
MGPLRRSARRSLLMLAFGALAIPSIAQAGERNYEQVSPLFKGGYGATQMIAVSPSGETVSYSSPGGAFAGSLSDGGILDYQAVRGPERWESTALNPPGSAHPFAYAEDGFSPSGEESLWDLPLEGANSSLTSNASLRQQFFVRRADGFHAIGPVLQMIESEQKAFEVVVIGESDDFCHAIVQSSFPLAEPMEPIGNGGSAQLYDVDSGCATGEPHLRVVALNNAGQLLSPKCELRSGKSLSRVFNPVSSDGDIVYFEAHVTNKCLSPQNEQVFARVGGARTLEVSRPLEPGKEFGGCSEGGEPGEVPGEVPCSDAGSRPPAAFQGASDDGSVVYFTTAARLDPSQDLDSGSDLYAAHIGCPGEAGACPPAQKTVTSLVQVSHDPNAGEAADAQGVVAVSHDGSHVYFVARGALTNEGPGTAGAQQQPVPGADNLYVYERDLRFPTGHIEFVADICSGPVLSGSVSDSRCPEDLEEETSVKSSPRNDVSLMGREPHAQTVGTEGGMLVLTTYGQLLDSGPEADADNAHDVYRFDSQSKALLRVSIGEEGASGNGNEDDERSIGREGEGLENADARIQLPNQLETPNEERIVLRQAASADGSRIVFSTAESLSEQASNGVSDVYEWHEGNVSLISTGSSVEADEWPVITPSGRDVFFVTAQGLVSQDTDGAPDVYDARIGGGFPVPPPPVEQCHGDACQGPLTNPAALLVPGSATQAPGENLPAPTKHVAAKKKKKKASRHSHKRRRHPGKKAKRSSKRAIRGSKATHGKRGGRR